MQSYSFNPHEISTRVLIIKNRSWGIVYFRYAGTGRGYYDKDCFKASRKHKIIALRTELRGEDPRQR